MTQPAKDKWWDDVVSVDTVELNDDVYLLWGDRVRVLQSDGDRRRVFARGATGWVHKDALGGQPLLEVYFIDVGQGDGILVVTPEGHHLLVDGGHYRTRQQTGKSGADFVDWKFHKDYLFYGAEREDAARNVVRLDAMIASHADEDHYGGLRDLVDRTGARVDELDTKGVTVEAFYHPGLCPQVGGTDDLGAKEDGHFVSLLGDRASAVEGLKETPVGAPPIRGRWKDFIEAVVRLKTKAGDDTPIVRLSQETPFLPGFSDADETSVKIRVLAPIEKDVNGKPGLEDIGDEGENKNGHSVALRLDYGDRKILLTGDLNERAQAGIMAHYGADFEDTWRSDVAKACHHGSHHVDFEFLKGVAALSTVFSSGDANTYDHPRAWVLGAAALAGRVIDDPDNHRLKAPLVYSTEVARSLSLDGVEQLREYTDPQEYGREKGDPLQTVSGAVTTSKWRLVLDRDSDDAKDLPPVSDARVMHHVIYGLVNVRTDGKRLLFAVRNEGNHAWAYETMEEDDIARAYRVVPEE